MSASSTRLARHEVARCPRCGRHHRFAIELRIAQEQAEMLFGGPGDSRQVEVGFTCPDTKELFTDHVALQAGQEFVRVVTTADLPQAVDEKQLPTVGADHEEFTEWVKSSRTVATDFCKTMLTTASGAIPVYFAVLKYLGAERVGGSALDRLTLLPPILFLGTIVVFVAALRPQLAALRSEDFTTYRQSRLLRLDRFIAAGTSLFVVGVALALLLFAQALGTV